MDFEEESWDLRRARRTKSVTVLRQLSYSSEERVLVSVLNNDLCPVDVVSRLAKHSDAHVRFWAIRHRDIPFNLLCEAAQDEEGSVRCCVAHHKRTPVALLVQLSSDPHESVRCCVLDNRNTPDEVFIAACNDEDRRVRCRAATASRSVDILLKLAEDEDEVVLREVLRRKDCPPAVKMWLKSDYKYSMSLKEFLDVMKS